MVRKLLRLSTKKHKKDCKTEVLQSLYLEVLLTKLSERTIFSQSDDYLPFSRSAFSLASTSRSPRLVPAATLLMTGVS